MTVDEETVELPLEVMRRLIQMAEWGPCSCLACQQAVILGRRFAWIDDEVYELLEHPVEDLVR